MERLLLSGNEAVARAAFNASFVLGSGYPGTPATEILEALSDLGGKAEWAPNEKVALEVGFGVALGGGRALVAMKHVGLNVAADPLFSAAYIGAPGALVIAVADDPGMVSSQNEQDTRRYAVAAGVPLLEPSDSQEAYDFLVSATEISERWGTPVLLRLTTRICHSKSVVTTRKLPPPKKPKFARNIEGRVMIPQNARPAHRRLRRRLESILKWNETSPLNVVIGTGKKTGIISSGASAMHSQEACPDARILKLGMPYPFPMKTINRFVKSVRRCTVIEENDPVLYDAIRAAGIHVSGKPEMYRFGELNVSRIRRILAGNTTPEEVPPPTKSPELCYGCFYRTVFEVLRDLKCIAPGDIGCYTLGALPPFGSMDLCACMGAAIGAGLGLRHTLPPKEAKKVVSVIGDSTFIHGGITGLVEMVYNPPATGHVVLILDNGTTAMTGFQEHPGTGRDLSHKPASRVVIEDLASAMGIRRVHVINPGKDRKGFVKLLKECLASKELCVIVARQLCLLAAKHIGNRKKRK